MKILKNVDFLLFSRIKVAVRAILTKDPFHSNKFKICFSNEFRADLLFLTKIVLLEKCLGNSENLDYSLFSRINSGRSILAKILFSF